MYIKKDTLDLDDWSNKYDITITVLSQEYYSLIENIRHSDEKANKYLVIISIFLAGLFTILASSLLDNLDFQTKPLTAQSLLSWLFIITLVSCSVFGIQVVSNLLNSLHFIPTRKLPDLKIKLQEYGKNNSTEYKSILIDEYQAALNEILDSIPVKQQRISSAAKQMPIFIGLMVLSIAILILVKLVK